MIFFVFINEFSGQFNKQLKTVTFTCGRFIHFNEFMNQKPNTPSDKIGTQQKR